MDSTAVKIANEKLWEKYPELNRRQLTTKPEDEFYAQEWKRLYSEAKNNKAPEPKVTPNPVVPPASKSPAVAQCQLEPSIIETDDCKEIAKHVQEGDIVVRGESGDSESDFIAKVSKCQFSHAGVVARDKNGDLVVVDAYPGRGPNNSQAVGTVTIEEFFCGHHGSKPTQGMVTRPKNNEAAKKAAEWAMKETEDPDYEFELFDPWNENNKNVYCSDFVYQSFQNAGVDLVPEKMDFLSEENKENTIDAARDFKGGMAKIASDKKIEEELIKQTGGGSEYITPCQVANNDNTDTVVDFERSSGGSGGKAKQ